MILCMFRDIPGTFFFSQVNFIAMDNSRLAAIRAYKPLKDYQKIKIGTYLYFD